MPEVSKVIPEETDKIVRFRCYACAVRWWDFLDNVKLEDPSHNCIVALCDPCEERFRKEGKFWLPNKWCCLT